MLPLSAVPMQRFQQDEEVDAVVIGTGAGGAPILARLAQAGRKVVALEAGTFQDPAKFASDEIAQSGLYWLDERISGGDTPVAFGKKQQRDRRRRFNFALWRLHAASGSA